MRRWVFVLLAACGGKPPVKPPPPVVVTPSPPPVVAPVAAACITPPDEGGAISNAAIVGTHAEFCVGKDGTACFSLDLDKGGLEKLSQPPAPVDGSGGHAEVSEPDLKVCNGANECQTLTPKVLPAAARIRAATNTNGTFAVFLLGDAPAGKGYAEVWDVTKSKKSSSFKYARGEFKCGDVAMLGNTVYVAASQCDQPAARAALYSLRGKKLGNVGGKDFGMYGNAFAHLDGGQWAFLEESGAQIAVQDVGTGKLVKTIELAPLWQLAGAQLGNPGESALLRLPDGKLAVIAGAPATGSIGIVDPVTDEVTTLPAAHCPDVPAPSSPQ